MRSTRSHSLLIRRHWRTLAEKLVIDAGGSGVALACATLAHAPLFYGVALLPLFFALQHTHDWLSFFILITDRWIIVQEPYGVRCRRTVHPWTAVQALDLSQDIADVFCNSGTLMFRVPRQRYRFTALAPYDQLVAVLS